MGNKKAFECTHCSKVLSSKRSLQEHERIHTAEKPFECSLCDSKFTAKGKLRDHLKTHTGERPFECSYCQKRFFLRSQLTVHEKRHTSEFQCSYCEKKFADKFVLQSHERSHLNEKKYSCPHCEKKFISSSALCNHKKWHDGEKKFECSLCPKKFLTKNCLKRHIVIHTGEKPFQCSYCDMRFNCRSNCKAHEQIHTRAQLDIITPIDEKKSECTEIFQDKLQSAKMIDEMSSKLHEEEKKPPNVTPEDEMSSPSQLVLEGSLTKEERPKENSSRTEAGEKPFQCSYCEKTFRFKGNMVNHEKRIHTNEKPFQCLQCKKKFITRYELKFHKLKVHSEREFTCPHCSYKFQSKANLQRHIRVNTREKHVSCSYCSEKFEADCALKEHVKIHITLKVFSCQQCNAEFTTKSLLSKHVEIHASSDCLKYEEEPASPTSVKDSGEEAWNENMDEQKFCIPEVQRGISSTAGHSQNDSSSYSQTHTAGKIYGCMECKKEFTLKTALRKHENTHHGKKTFQCSQCGKKCFSTVMLKTHLKVHTGKNVFVCHYCNVEFATDKILKKHILLYTAEKLYKCPHCDAVFEAKCILREHVRNKECDKKLNQNALIHTKKDKSKTLLTTLLRRIRKSMPQEETGKERTDLKCLPQIGEYSPAVNSLKDEESPSPPKVQDICFAKDCQCPDNCSLHASTENHEILFRCSHCKEEFRVENELVLHEKTHAKDTALQCSQCARKFGSENDLVQHKKTHKDKEECRFPSEEHTQCKGKVSLTSLLRRHRKSLQSGEVEVTDQVDVPQVTKDPPLCSALDCPMPVEEMNEERTDLKSLPQIEENSPEADSLKDEESCPSPKVQDKCPAKDCHCPDNCSLHANAETHEVLLSCSHCEEKFRTENNLIQHEETHTKDRAFQCTQCAHKFGSENALAQHEATHKTIQRIKVFSVPFLSVDSLQKNTHNVKRRHPLLPV
ncbi:zinc finger protein 420-like [Penaeus indicus]|uniref:zinc finger protein 420-like n=1 Tax=Penaeus indicus TaxID=29960 RepID=UPI00300D4EAE